MGSFFFFLLSLNLSHRPITLYNEFKILCTGFCCVNSSYFHNQPGCLFCFLSGFFLSFVVNELMAVIYKLLIQLRCGWGDGRVCLTGPPVLNAHNSVCGCNNYL